MVECTFGIYKRRWACLNKLRLPSPEFSASVIKACAVLHNISIQAEPLDPEEVNAIMREIEEREGDIEDEIVEEGVNIPGQIRRANLVALFN